MVYVTHVSVYVTHGSCKRGDLPAQDAREAARITVTLKAASESRSDIRSQFNTLV